MELQADDAARAILRLSQTFRETPNPVAFMELMAAIEDLIQHLRESQPRQSLDRQWRGPGPSGRRS